MEILLILTVATVNILCFFIGAKVGQTVARGEAIKAPDLNPVKAFREHRVQKEADKEAKRLEVIMNNIDTYDGTSQGQRAVPGVK